MEHCWCSPIVESTSSGERDILFVMGHFNGGPPRVFPSKKISGVIVTPRWLTLGVIFNLRGSHTDLLQDILVVSLLMSLKFVQPEHAENGLFTHG